MDSFIRLLREGRTVSDVAAPLVLVIDSLDVLGGPCLFRKSVVSFLDCLSQGRAQARQLSVITSCTNVATYSNISADFPGVQTCIISIIDNSFHRLTSRSTSGQEESHSAGTVKVVNDLRSAVDSIASTSTDANSTFVVFDDLSQLIDTHTFNVVVDCLQLLCECPAISCMLGLIHQDVVSTQQLHTLSLLCICQATLGCVDGMAREEAAAQCGVEPHGHVRFSYKRRATGRLRSERVLYALRGGAELQLLLPSCGSAAAPGGQLKQIEGQTGALKLTAPDGKGGMRLELSDKEREAKQKVVLPYQHQGQSGVYQSQDFKDYLPVAAGGSNNLGHVMYVRDSDEEHDSDEDPDDDLDI